MEHFKKEIKEREHYTYGAPTKHEVESICHNPRKEPVAEDH